MAARAEPEARDDARQMKPASAAYASHTENNGRRDPVWPEMDITGDDGVIAKESQSNNASFAFTSDSGRQSEVAHVSLAASAAASLASPPGAGLGQLAHSTTHEHTAVSSQRGATGDAPHAKKMAMMTSRLGSSDSASKRAVCNKIKVFALGLKEVADSTPVADSEVEHVLQVLERHTPQSTGEGVSAVSCAAKDMSSFKHR